MTVGGTKGGLPRLRMTRSRVSLLAGTMSRRKAGCRSAAKCQTKMVDDMQSAAVIVGTQREPTRGKSRSAPCRGAVQNA
jgi:hypothetical protein